MVFLAAIKLKFQTLTGSDHDPQNILIYLKTDDPLHGQDHQLSCANDHSITKLFPLIFGSFGISKTVSSNSYELVHKDGNLHVFKIRTYRMFEKEIDVF